LPHPRSINLRLCRFNLPNHHSVVVHHSQRNLRIAAVHRQPGHFTATFSSEELLNCTDIGCPFPEDGNYYSVDYDQGARVTIGVAGIGTYADAYGEDIVGFYYNPPDIDGIQVSDFYDPGGLFDLGPGFTDSLGEGCYNVIPYWEYQYCPLQAYTYGGALTLTSSDGVLIPSVSISSEPTPEPDTLLLTASGLLGCLGLAWRRVLRTTALGADL
jgi:hypothetical protein